METHTQHDHRHGMRAYEAGPPRAGPGLVLSSFRETSSVIFYNLWYFSRKRIRQKEIRKIWWKKNSIFIEIIFQRRHYASANANFSYKITITRKAFDTSIKYNLLTKYKNTEPPRQSNPGRYIIVTCQIPEKKTKNTYLSSLVSIPHCSPNQIRPTKCCIFVNQGNTD